MVPADDEHKSANEAEKNTSTQKNFVEKLKFWKRCKQEDNKPARLTPMPPCLMKWWTPLLLAAILFGPSLIFAIIWGGQPHWPSSKAMKLCATIAGAGFAFSAWQQRSHANLTHEQNRFDDNQRDEFWRRRESAHTLLNACSYAQQLEAVIRYLEMSDQIIKFEQIFRNTGPHYQEAILTTLCAHIRKLGEADKTTLSELERARLQKIIIEHILQRINDGPWNGLQVDLSETHFLTDLAINHLKTESIIYLNKSTFDYELSINAPSTITVHWEDAEFHGKLTIAGTSSTDEPTKSIIYHDNLPHKIDIAIFQNVAFSKISGSATQTHNMPIVETCNEHGRQYNGRHFTNCYFIRRNDRFDASHTLKLFYLSRSTTQSHSICTAYLPESYSWATIDFQDQSRTDTHNRTTNYYLQGCQFGEIQATLGKIASRISLKECLFSNSYGILFTSTIKPHSRHNGESDGIHIIDCTITSTELTSDSLPPIKALYKGFTPHPPLIHFTTESRIICNEDQAPTIYRLTAEPMDAHTNGALHATKIDDDNRTGKTPTFSWEYTYIA